MILIIKLHESFQGGNMMVLTTAQVILTDIKGIEGRIQDFF